MPTIKEQQPEPKEPERVTHEVRVGGSITIQPETAQPEAEDNA